VHILGYVKGFFNSKLRIKEDNLNIVSIGCGPCSEAFALDSFLTEIGYKYKNKINFIGFDMNPVWEDVQNKVKECITQFPINIETKDCFEYIKSKPDFIYPNILILNYVLSDVYKHDDIDIFIKNTVSDIINQMPDQSIIIVNDINCARTDLNIYGSCRMLVQEAGEKNNVKFILDKYAQASGASAQLIVVKISSRI
jgi:hypothetical protein